MTPSSHRPEIDTTPVAGENDVVFPRLDRAQMATMGAAGRRSS